MKIAIASLNILKVLAVQEVVEAHEFFSGTNVLFERISVPSHVSEQPLSIKEMVQGAKNRARNAYDKVKDCDLAVGIESGIHQFDEIPDTYFNSALCALYDGTKYYVGISYGYPVPLDCIKLIKEKNITWVEAAHEVGLVSSDKAARSEELLDQDEIFTRRLISRKDAVKQAFISALVHITNPKWFHNHVIQKQNSFNTHEKQI